MNSNKIDKRGNINEDEDVVDIGGYHHDPVQHVGQLDTSNSVDNGERTTDY